MQPGIIRQHGFIWLALARENVMPLTLLEKKKDSFFKRLFAPGKEADALNATIFSLFPKKGKGVIPEPSGPHKAAFFKGFDVLDVRSEANVSSNKAPLLGQVEGSAKLATASKLLYSFVEVMHYGVETEVLLEEYLNTAKVVENAHGFLDKLHNGELYVVTDVLRTREFSVKDISELSWSGDLNAEVVEQLKVKASIQSDHEKKKELYFKGDVPLTFALKASRIFFNKEEGHYTLNKDKKLRTAKGANDLNKEDIPDDAIDISE
jgi:hypothetical protein